jgi:hypothetical protein
MDNKELYNNILNAANHIAKISRTGSANYIVVNEKIATLLQNKDIKKERRNKLKNILKDE